MIEKRDFEKIIKKLEVLNLKPNDVVFKTWYDVFKDHDKNILLRAVYRLILDWDSSYPPAPADLRDYYIDELHKNEYCPPPSEIEKKKKQFCKHCNNTGWRSVEMVMLDSGMFQVYDKKGKRDYSKYYVDFVFRCDCPEGEKYQRFPKWTDYFDEMGYLKKKIYF